MHPHEEVLVFLHLDAAPVESVAELARRDADVDERRRLKLEQLPRQCEPKPVVQVILHAQIDLVDSLNHFDCGSELLHFSGL